MIITWLYLQAAQLILLVSLFLVQHLTPVTDIVPLWFATGSVAVSSLVATITQIWPWDTTIGPSLVIMLLVDGAIVAYMAIMWILRKLPGVN